MSAFATIELDTTPPQVDFGQPRWAEDGLEVDYSVDEPGVTQADFNGEPVNITPDMFTLARTPLAGVLTVRVADDVLNARDWELHIASSASYPPRGMDSYGAAQGASFEDGGGGAYAAQPGVDFDREVGETYEVDPDESYDRGDGPSYADDSDSSYSEAGAEEREDEDSSYGN